MQRYTSMGLILGLFSSIGAGCCCVQGMPGSSCGNSCGPGPIASLAGCRGACGEMYVDEWISEPPVVDNCGGCGRCDGCRPVRNLLSVLWGRPYISGCSTGLCGPSCNSCDSMGYGEQSYDEEQDSIHDHSGHSSSAGCNCGQSHSSHAHPLPPSGGTLSPVPPSGPNWHPSQNTPTLAPPVIPTSAKRLNPATTRRR